MDIFRNLNSSRSSVSSSVLYLGDLDELMFLTVMAGLLGYVHKLSKCNLASLCLYVLWQSPCTTDESKR